MRIARRGLAATIALLCLSIAGAPRAAPITYLSPDNINQIPVSAANPLPTTGGGGGGGSNAAASATGSAVPSSASYTGLNFGGNLKGWTGDTNGYGDVNVMNVPSVAQSGTWTVNIGSGSVTFSGALPANPVTNTNVSTTVTTGGTFQSVLASNSARNGCLIQNPVAATETLFVYFGTNASATTAKSIGLSPGSGVTCAVGGIAVATDNVSVTATTTAHVFVVTSQ